MNKKFKSIKVKLYHKLINNKLIYDNKPLIDITIMLIKFQI